MAENRRSQTASDPAVAAQPGPRLPPQGPTRRPLVSAPAARSAGALRRREDAGPGPRSAASRAPDAAGAPRAPGRSVSAPRHAGRPRGLGRAHRPRGGVGAPAPPGPGVPAAAPPPAPRLASRPAGHHPGQPFDSHDPRGAGLDRGPGRPGAVRIPAAPCFVAQSGRDLVRDTHPHCAALRLG